MTAWASRPFEPWRGRGVSMTGHAWMAGCTSAALYFGASAAWAQQGFALDRFNPSEAGSEWFALDTLDMRSRPLPALSLLGEVAHRPLATYSADGAVRAPVVENQAFLRVAGSMMVFDRLRLALGLPVAVYQNGKSDEVRGVRYAAPSSEAAVADFRVSADARLVGEPGTAFALAAGVQVFLPLGSRSQYTGDGSVRILPRAIAAGEVGLFAYSAQVGFQYRALSEDFGAGAIGSEMLFGCAFGVRLAERRLLVGPELFGSTVVPSSSAFGEVNTPVELLVGAHLRLPAGMRMGAGGGLGLSRGLGSPQARLVASLGWEPEAEAVIARGPEATPALPVKPLDRGADGRQSEPVDARTNAPEGDSFDVEIPRVPTSGE
jgi:OOP family OmpA-OmpF porin